MPLVDQVESGAGKPCFIALRFFGQRPTDREGDVNDAYPDRQTETKLGATGYSSCQATQTLVECVGPSNRNLRCHIISGSPLLTGGSERAGYKVFLKQLIREEAYDARRRI